MMQVKPRDFKKMICPMCKRPAQSSRSFKIREQQMRAVKWLLANKHIWRGKIVEQYQYPRTSLAWRLIGHGLKWAGIYKNTYGIWDMAIDRLVKEAKGRMRKKRTNSNVTNPNHDPLKVVAEIEKRGAGRVLLTTKPKGAK